MWSITICLSLSLYICLADVCMYRVILNEWTLHDDIYFVIWVSMLLSTAVWGASTLAVFKELSILLSGELQLMTSLMHGLLWASSEGYFDSVDNIIQYMWKSTSFNHRTSLFNCWHQWQMIVWAGGSLPKCLQKCHCTAVMEFVFASSSIAYTSSWLLAIFR